MTLACFAIIMALSTVATAQSNNTVAIKFFPKLNNQTFHKAKWKKVTRVESIGEGILSITFNDGSMDVLTSSSSNIATLPAQEAKIALNNLYDLVATLKSNDLTDSGIANPFLDKIKEAVVNYDPTVKNPQQYVDMFRYDFLVFELAEASLANMLNNAVQDIFDMSAVMVGGCQEPFTDHNGNKVETCEWGEGTNGHSGYSTITSPDGSGRLITWGPDGYGGTQILYDSDKDDEKGVSFSDIANAIREAIFGKKEKKEKDKDKDFWIPWWQEDAFMDANPNALSLANCPEVRDYIAGNISQGLMITKLENLGFPSIEHVRIVQ